MKKVIETIVAAAILFGTATAMAKEPKLETDGISKSIVFEWETQLSEASLKIFDKSGNVMYSDYVNEADAYAKKFDLTRLTEGAYFLKIENGAKEFVYSIAINTNSISILGMEENSKPIFRHKEGRVYLNFMNREKEEVKVGVTDSLGNVLFKETIKDSFLVEKAFNFKGAFDGDYTIAVSKDEKTYYETITVK